MWRLLRAMRDGGQSGLVGEGNDPARLRDELALMEVTQHAGNDFASGAKLAGKPSGKPGNKTAGKKVGKSSGPYDAKRGGGPGKPKGGKNLAPSVGKHNSKKNKARRAAAHDAGQPPRRAKS